MFISLVVPTSIPCAAAETLPVPREQTVVVESISSSFNNYESFNPLGTIGVEYGSGIQVCEESVAYINPLSISGIEFWKITGYETENNYTRVILHIREGVTWNDGYPYTSDDWVFTYNLLMNDTSQQLSGAWWVQSTVSSFEAPDNYTFIVNLKRSIPRIIWELPTTTVSRHIWEGHDPNTFKNNPPVGTGPYKLYGVYPAFNMFIWVRDENYWGKKFGYFPEAKYVIYKCPAPRDVMFADFVQGATDAPLLMMFTYDLVQMAQSVMTNISTVEYKDPLPYGFFFNTREYPLSVPALRWAISYCVDRETLGNVYSMAEHTDPHKYPIGGAIYPSVQQKWGAMLDRVMQRIEDEYGYTYPTYNLTKAEEILDGLNFVDTDGDGIRETTNGTKLSFEVLCEPAGTFEYTQTLTFVENLRAVGIAATMRALGWGGLGTYTMEGRYQIASTVIYSNTPYSSDIFYSLINDPTEIRNEETGYYNPEVNAYVQILKNMSSDDPAAAPLLEEALYLVLRDLPFVTTLEQKTTSPFSTKYWTGWPTNDNMYAVPYTWWANFLFVLLRIKAVAPAAPVNYQTVWFIGSVEQFNSSIDGRTYGPFVEGESAAMPEGDAQRLIGEELASLTPVTLLDAISGISGQLAAMSNQLTTLSQQVSGVPEQWTALSSQLSTLTIFFAIETVAIVILAVGLVLALRKKS
jgi:peptide/nickel transport system substrate-binding protein